MDYARHGRNVPRTLQLLAMVAYGITSDSLAQVDPNPRSLLQLGYDQALQGKGPQAAYAYYYYNAPSFLRTNMALRLAVAPVYFDGEIGFRHFLSKNTDVGIGLSGGGYGDAYYEVRQGHYFKNESFDGHGGGASLNLYHRINPRQLIPLSFVFKAGARYLTYSTTGNTDPGFQVPEDRVDTFVRTGLRFAGKEPMLYPDLAMEISIWFESQWRTDEGSFGFNQDRRIEDNTKRYWLYAGLNYAWTNSGHQMTFALTAGGADHADRFSAWRLGGVLPLAAEFPLTLPGYYYTELSANRFVHLMGGYIIPLSPNHRWQIRLEAASARVNYLEGFRQDGHWQTGAGSGLSYSSPSGTWRIILRYGYGFNAVRDGQEGAHSVGLLSQYNFAKRRFQ